MLIEYRLAFLGLPPGKAASSPGKRSPPMLVGEFRAIDSFPTWPPSAPDEVAPGSADKGFLASRPKRLPSLNHQLHL